MARKMVNRDFHFRAVGGDDFDFIDLHAVFTLGFGFLYFARNLGKYDLDGMRLGDCGGVTGLLAIAKPEPLPAAMSMATAPRRMDFVFMSCLSSVCPRGTVPVDDRTLDNAVCTGLWRAFQICKHAKRALPATQKTA